MKRSRTLLICLGIFVAAATTQFSIAKDNADTALPRATETVEHMSQTAPDKGVPREVLEGAKCVAVIPHLIKGAFIVGAEHGVGVATCKTGGSWSAPAPFAVTGISWGPQIGGESSDIMMFIMNDDG